MNSFEDVWEIVLGILREKTNSVMYNLFLEPLKFSGYDNDKMYLIIDAEFKQNLIYDKLINQINEAFESVLGFPVETVIKLVQPEAEQNNTKINDQQNTISAGYTFDSFIVGKENQFAYSVALSAATEPGIKVNPVLIYGASGLGKTHLMYATYNMIKHNNPNANIIVTTSETFMNELHEHIKMHSQMDFHKKYRNADALFIDDIQFIARGGTSVQEEMFHCFDKLYQEGKQIFMTSDRPPREINPLEDRLRSRFSSGVLQDILPPDKDTRMAIISKKAEQKGLNLPTGTIEFIADRMKTNVRQIESIVNKINASKDINKKLPDTEQIKKMINELTTEHQPASITIDKILERITTDTQISTADIKSKKRDKKIKDARQMAMYIIRQKTNLTLKQIGEVFNNTHSTVVHSLETVEKEMQENPSYRMMIENILNDN